MKVGNEMAGTLKKRMSGNSIGQAACTATNVAENEINGSLYNHHFNHPYEIPDAPAENTYMLPKVN